MQSTPIHFMTIREQADLLSSGEITSVELTRHFLDRADELDPPPFELPSEPRSDHDGMLSTMVTIAREHALEAAERADDELRAGRRRSILHGIPYGVKDLLDTDGIRTTWGSRIFHDRVPTRNAAVIDRLAASGAVLMAKMSLGEFAGGKHQLGTESMEAGSHQLRVVERYRRGCGRGTDRVRDRDGDRRVHRLPGLLGRGLRTPAHLQPRESIRMHAAFLESGQDRAGGSVGGGLWIRPRADQRLRCARQLVERTPFRVPG